MTDVTYQLKGHLAPYDGKFKIRGSGLNEIKVLFPPQKNSKVGSPGWLPCSMSMLVSAGLHSQSFFIATDGCWGASPRALSRQQEEEKRRKAKKSFPWKSYPMGLYT